MKKKVSCLVVAIIIMTEAFMSCGKEVSSQNDNEECICIHRGKWGYILSNISEEILESLNFVMYPNPSSDVIYLIFKTEGVNNVTIIDKKRKVIFKQSFDVQTIAILIRDYAVGEYQVTVDNGKQKSTLCLIKIDK